jgi:hypothetical protein
MTLGLPARLSQLYIPHGGFVATKVESAQAWTFAEEKLLEAHTLARQFLVIAPGHHHHGVAAAHNHLGLSPKGAVYHFAKAILSICQTP